MRYVICLLVSVVLASCGTKEKPVLVSLLGKTYYEPKRNEKVQARLDSNLARAKRNWEADPSEDNYIWYARRLGYLSRFQESVDIMTEALAKFPNSARLYRHRGHRYISMRQFDKAIADLIKAKDLAPTTPLDIEPDGVPNKINTPLSSLQFNIWYHLGLAHYLKGEFANAENAYHECLKTCTNDDLTVAVVDWLYMTYRRQGKEAEAANLLTRVTDSMTVVENDAYLNRCMMYQGKMNPADLLKVSIADLDQAALTMATQGYGVGNWYLCNGDREQAKQIFEQVVAGEYFGAFGFIAAEAELARWEK
jgi:tetratricopeptide (TPR) repeat protein